MVVSTSVAHRIPAGWYPDRDDRSRRRWWDGEEWTDYYAVATELPERPVARIEEQAARRESPEARPESEALAKRETRAERKAHNVPGVHTLSGALTFSDRLPAFILLGLAAANLLLLGVLVRFL